MGICNPSPEFLTVFVVGLSRISGVVPTYLRMSLTRAVERLPLFAVQPSGGTEVVYILTTRRVPGYPGTRVTNYPATAALLADIR